LTGELFAKGVVKNTGTSTIASVNIFADEFDIANHFIQRTQSAPNTMSLKPGEFVQLHYRSEKTFYW
jgi:hypothetical protein